MLKIGEFSKLSRVSIRMLRHYDDIGLLKPAEIDDFTGYRYYREEQLFTVGRITSLKDMGFALADIIKILIGQHPCDICVMRVLLYVIIRIKGGGKLGIGNPAVGKGTREQNQAAENSESEIPLPER